MAHRLLSTAHKLERQFLNGVQHGRLNTAQVLFIIVAIARLYNIYIMLWILHTQKHKMMQFICQMLLYWNK